MEVAKLNIVRFAPRGKDSFYEHVIGMVDNYFKTNNISPYADKTMWLKTVVMLLLYFAPYVMIVSGIAAANIWLFYGLWVVMAFGMSGIGTSVMHDAHHGTYSSNQNVNKAVGFILEAIGGSSITWKIQHNLLHHTYTNITGLDEDIDSIKLLRFSPRQPKYWFHRFQYIYAWFFYMIMTLYWMTAKDYRQVMRYHKINLLSKQKLSLSKAIIFVTLPKLIYYIYILVIPILYCGMLWYHVVGGFLLMHFISGLFLSCIFQPAHVMESSEFAMPVISEGKRKMENSWAIHEVANTTNFAPGNSLLTWFIGALNFQIEHHLFSGVCHVHYKKLAPIVKSACEAYNIPYHEQPSFTKALFAHMKMLKQLGQA